VITGVSTPNYTSYSGIQKTMAAQRIATADLTPIDMTKLKTVNLSALAGAGEGGEWGWDPSGIHSEIKVDGVVVGRVYNSGVTELHEPYEYLANKLDPGGPGEAGLEGPDLAHYRIALISEALKNQNAQIVATSTAMTQAEWLARPSGGAVDRLA